jgi:alpha-galactosidase
MSTAQPQPSRREVIKGVASAAVASSPLSAVALAAMETSDSFLNILRSPDLVRAFGPSNSEIHLTKVAEGQWTGEGVEVIVASSADHSTLSLRSDGHVCRLQFRWRGNLKSIKRCLGDHWERSYGDLEWRGDVPMRTMPWYFMAFDGHRTHGYGVRTSPKAFIFWNSDLEGISLWADVRSGGVPVKLGERLLNIADVVCREGKNGESPFLQANVLQAETCGPPCLRHK